MKKIITLLFCGVLLSSAAYGCGDGSSSSEYTPITETKRVGEPKYGFIDIPKYFDVYTDEAAAQQGFLQYSDSRGANIISLAYFTDTTAQDLTLAYWNSLEPQVTNLTSAIVEINGTKTYQLYGVLPDMGKIMALWVLDGEDGVTHCITIEGTDRAVFDMPDTFKPTE